MADGSYDHARLSKVDFPMREDGGRQAEREKDRGTYRDLSGPGPGWPYLKTNHIFLDEASKEIGTPEKTKRNLQWRLGRFSYPYPDGNKKGKTFFGHLKALGVLNLVLEHPVLSTIIRRNNQEFSCTVV
jgi:hypothetical protein